MLEINCTLKGVDPIGEVQSYAIKIRGRLAIAHLVHKWNKHDNIQNYKIE